MVIIPGPDTASARTKCTLPELGCPKAPSAFPGTNTVALPACKFGAHTPAAAHMVQHPARTLRLFDTLFTLFFVPMSILLDRYSHRMWGSSLRRYVVFWPFQSCLNRSHHSQNRHPLSLQSHPIPGLIPLFPRMLSSSRNMGCRFSK